MKNGQTCDSACVKKHGNIHAGSMVVNLILVCACLIILVTSTFFLHSPSIISPSQGRLHSFRFDSVTLVTEYSLKK